jgi:hypothetical protein
MPSGGTSPFGRAGITPLKPSAHSRHFSVILAFPGPTAAWYRAACHDMRPSWHKSQRRHTKAMVLIRRYDDSGITRRPRAAVLEGRLHCLQRRGIVSVSGEPTLSHLHPLSARGLICGGRSPRSASQGRSSESLNFESRWIEIIPYKQPLTNRNTE